MSSHWRASLVPAAAVIPAPRAYTNIAAVKTLVVCPRVQVCQGQLRLRCGTLWCSTPYEAMGLLCRRPAGTQPLVVCSCAHIQDGGTAPAQSHLHWWPEAAVHRMLVWTLCGNGPVPWNNPVRQRSPPSVTSWKTQCAQSIQSWLDACP